MTTKQDIAGNNINGAQLVYVDENSINRSIAALILSDGGASCIAVATIRAMMDAIGRTNFDAVVIDLQTAMSDPEGLEIAKHDPRFRDLPLLAFGANEADAKLIGAERFIPAPLDPAFFLSTVAKTLSSQKVPGSSAGYSPIARNALLSRVSGKPDAAAHILTQFMQDYSGFDRLIEEAASRADNEKAEFLLRNLRSAASAVGADELYRLAGAIQDSAQRKSDISTEQLSHVLRETLLCAAEMRRDLQKLSFGEPIEHKEAAPDAAESRKRGTPQPQPPKSESERRPLILAVDDSPANLKLLETCLQDEYRILLAANGEEAIRAARGQQRPALVLLDVTMPGIDGYEVCRLLKEDPRTRAVPVVFLTSLSKEADEERGLALGAVDYIRKPFSVPILKARIRSHLDLQRYREYLETLVDERTRELRETQREVIYRLARAAEYRDNDTGSHIKRIGYYSLTIAETLSFPQSEADILYYASAMHDVGKIGIPDHILLKPGRLDKDEWDIMKQHPTIGAGLLEGHPSALLRIASRVALSHHEKWDGTGYPSGSKGDEIPIEGRIVAVCDVFDALLSSRPYKPAWTPEETLDEINRLSGTHFDPAIVRAFNSVYPDLLRIKARFED